jgi:hypothetical protein
MLSRVLVGLVCLWWYMSSVTFTMGHSVLHQSWTSPSVSPFFLATLQMLVGIGGGCLFGGAALWTLPARLLAAVKRKEWQLLALMAGHTAGTVFTNIGLALVTDSAAWHVLSLLEAIAAIFLSSRLAAAESRTVTRQVVPALCATLGVLVFFQQEVANVSRSVWLVACCSGAAFAVRNVCFVSMTAEGSTASRSAAARHPSISSTADNFAFMHAGGLALSLLLWISSATLGIFLGNSSSRVSGALVAYAALAHFVAAALSFLILRSLGVLLHAVAGSLKRLLVVLLATAAFGNAALLSAHQVIAAAAVSLASVVLFSSLRPRPLTGEDLPRTSKFKLLAFFLFVILLAVGRPTPQGALVTPEAVKALEARRASVDASCDALEKRLELAEMKLKAAVCMREASGTKTDAAANLAAARLRRAEISALFDAEKKALSVSVEQLEHARTAHAALELELGRLGSQLAHGILLLSREKTLEAEAVRQKVSLTRQIAQPRPLRMLLITNAGSGKLSDDMLPAAWVTHVGQRHLNWELFFGIDVDLNATSARKALSRGGYIEVATVSSMLVFSRLSAPRPSASLSFFDAVIVAGGDMGMPMRFPFNKGAILRDIPLDVPIMLVGLRATFPEVVRHTPWLFRARIAAGKDAGSNVALGLFVNFTSSDSRKPYDYDLSITDPKERGETRFMESPDAMVSVPQFFFRCPADSFGRPLLPARLPSNSSRPPLCWLLDAATALHTGIQAQDDVIVLSQTEAQVERPTVRSIRVFEGDVVAIATFIRSNCRMVAANSPHGAAFAVRLGVPVVGDPGVRGRVLELAGPGAADACIHEGLAQLTADALLACQKAYAGRIVLQRLSRLENSMSVLLREMHATVSPRMVAGAAR